MKNNDFIEKRPTNSSIYEQEKNTAKSKKTCKEILKNKNINNCLVKYI